MDQTDGQEGETVIIDRATGRELARIKVGTTISVGPVRCRVESVRLRGGLGEIEVVSSPERDDLRPGFIVMPGKPGEEPRYTTPAMQKMFGADEHEIAVQPEPDDDPTSGE